MNDKLLCIETYPFIQTLFEDLTLSLGYAGYRFQGGLDYIYITVLADPVELKNKLFLVFYDLARQNPEMNIFFTISHIDETVKWIFRSPAPLKGLGDPIAVPHWKPEFLPLESIGFYLELPAGPLEIQNLPFDRNKARELYLDDKLIDEVLTKFILRCQALIRELETAIQILNRDQIFKVTHTIKGSARNVFAIQIASEALQLEKIYKTADKTQLEHSYRNLKDRYNEFLQFLEYKS